MIVLEYYLYWDPVIWGNYSNTSGQADICLFSSMLPIRSQVIKKSPCVQRVQAPALGSRDDRLCKAAC
jgi:hypothetical protein